MRRAGLGIEREPDGSWRIAPDHLERAAAYEAARVRARPVAVSLLSARPLEALVEADGASWLDARLDDASAPPAREAGFGGQLADAERRRRQWLLAQGLAEERDGAVHIVPGALEQLRRRELVRVVQGLSDELGLPFDEVAGGERVAGVYRRRMDLLGGRFALIERAHDFTLVPWREVLDRHVGQQVSGVVRSDSVSWTIGRGRQGPSIG